MKSAGEDGLGPSSKSAMCLALGVLHTFGQWGVTCRSSRGLLDLKAMLC